MFSGSSVVAGDSSALILESTKQGVAAYQDEDYTRKKNQMKATLSKCHQLNLYLVKRRMTGW